MVPGCVLGCRAYDVYQLAGFPLYDEKIVFKESLLEVISVKSILVWKYGNLGRILNWK